MRVFFITLFFVFIISSVKGQYGNSCDEKPVLKINPKYGLGIGLEIARLAVIQCGAGLQVSGTSETGNNEIICSVLIPLIA